MAMPRCAWAGAWISPKRKGGVAGWWQLRHGPVHIFVCDCGAFVIWQTNWQQDVRSDSRSKRQGAFERVFWPGGWGTKGSGAPGSVDCLSAFMYARNSGGQFAGTGKMEWTELNWSEVKWSTRQKAEEVRRCAYILPLSLCVRLCVCVPATRSTFYFPSNKSIFRTTKNENEKRTSGAEVDASIETGVSRTAFG